MKRTDYVHGYSVREAKRLADQAKTLADLLHGDIIYPAGSRVLEAGCGIGAKTVTLATNSPAAKFVCIDISEESLRKARQQIESKGLTNVEFRQADIFNLTLPEESFDHIFVCFVLEHLEAPAEALIRLKKVLRTGGTLTAIEGDHGSAYFYPDSEYAKRNIQCLIDLQAKTGANSLIGRELFPLLTKCGFKNVRVVPKAVYADSSRPEMVEGFTKNTFTAMVEGVREQALGSGMIDEKSWDKGVADLYRTSESDGVFNYTFFKAVGVK